MDVRIETRGQSTRQPLTEELRRERHVAALERLRAEIESDFETVGHHRLDTERFRERGAAEPCPRSPDTGWCVLRGLHREGIEPAHGLRVGQVLNDLPSRAHELHRHRVLGRDGAGLVLDDQSEMKIIAGPPDAALAINGRLDPVGESLAADIEMAHGKRRAARELEIALIGAFLREEIERCGFDVDLCETVDVRSRVADALVLEIHEVDVDVSHRLRAPKVGGHDEKLPGRLAFDEKADIRSEKIAFVAHAARVLVVRVFAGIVSVAPAAAVAALPVIIFGIAPVAALLHPEVLVVHEGRFDILGRFLPWAGRGRIGPRDGERQLKKTARMLLEELGRVQTVAVPSVGLGGGER